MAEVAVVGAGIAGLGAALLLGRRGHDVLLVERDAAPLPDDAEDTLTRWPRPSVPQLGHGHSFHSLARRVLLGHAPDVLEALFALGAEEVRFCDRIPPERRLEADDELVAIACRRSHFEWVLRRAVEAEPRVELRTGTPVAGLVARDSGFGVPHVTGVRLADDTELSAELVVDTAGRNSRVAAWLAALGAGPPLQRVQESGTLYYARHFRFREGAGPPEGEGLFGPTGDLGYLRFSLLGEDAGTFVITLNTPPSDHELKVLRHERAWMAAASSMPLLVPWIDPATAEPITPVFSMGGLRNVLRSFVPAGGPLAVALHTIGDSFCHTNPTQGWGVSLALDHAASLADVLDAHPDDPLRQALALREAIWDEARARYETAAGEDRERRRILLREDVDWTRRDHPLFVRKVVHPAASEDPEIFRAVVRRVNLLDPPSRLLEDDELVGRAVALYEKRAQRPKPTEGPPREELLALVDARGRRRSTRARSTA